MNTCAVDLDEVEVPAESPDHRTPRANDTYEAEAFTKESKKKSKGNKKLEIFIAGLPFSCRLEEVREYFSTNCGDIVAFRMPIGKDGKHKGMAFIKFRDDEACCKALGLNATDFGGRKIIVNRAGPDNSAPKESPGASEDKGVTEHNKKKFELFIGGLPFETTEAILRRDFSECGEIVALRMVKNDEGQCKGVAFVEYKDNASCEKALKFDGTDYGSRVLKVRMASDTSCKDSQKGKGKGKDGAKSNPSNGPGKSARRKSNKDFEVFVGGLPYATEESVLRKDFEDCGPILSLRMPVNDEGQSKGIAFIEYGDKESCDKALAYDQTDYGGRTIYVRLSEHAGGSRPNAENLAPKTDTQEAKISTGSKNTNFELESDDA